MKKTRMPKMARKLRAVLNGADVYTLEEIIEIKANAFADGMEAERRKSKIEKRYNRE